MDKTNQALVVTCFSCLPVLSFIIATANKQVIVEGDTDHSPFANGARQILNLKQLSPTVFGILQSLKSDKGLTSLRLSKQ